jgi:malonate-semialdehyde dehydrogenase (acetylating)/methylmalonate-semialdehyde dehydrogenase
MPDADMDQAVDALIGAGYGSAGERCMAISVAVPVGQKTADILVEKLIPRVESLKVGPSTDTQADYGPMVTKAHIQKVRNYVDIGIKEGAKLVAGATSSSGLRERQLHGRLPVRRREAGDAHLQGGDIRAGAPVVRGDYEEAVRLPSEHEYGNGVPTTRDGDTARDFTSRVEVGMVGVNFVIPFRSPIHVRRLKRSGFGISTSTGRIRSAYTRPRP